jgi:hypothetical protein
MTDNIPLSPLIRRVARLATVRLASGFDRVLLYEFEALEAHRDFAEKHFTATAQALEERFAAEIAALPDDERNGHNDIWMDEYQVTAEILPRLQWYAQFLVAYSTFEHSLQRLCDIVKGRSGLPISYKDLAGAGIQRASEYLKKMAEVRTPFETPEWQRALLLGEVRNRIAHMNGGVPIQVEQKSLYQRAKTLEHLKFDESEGAGGAVLVLDAQFVRSALETLRKVLLNVANYELYPVDS